MADILIRDVAEGDVASLDAHAKAMGLSRAEFLRRVVRREASRPLPSAPRVTAEHLRRASELCADLLDEDVMRQAWS